MKLKVHESGRYLVHADGRPFFYLADTAWELLHRLNREEAELYLTTRARQRFTVIQAVVLAELDGLNTPNALGDRPLIDNDPCRPNDAYFRHVDALVARANTLGMVVALLPTWGDKLPQLGGKGPEVFNPDNAAVYGEYLGQRYKDADIIWMLGGDRPVRSAIHLLTWRAMARGLQAGGSGDQLITFHPAGRHSSSEYVHNQPWLDFNTFQSSHQGKNVPNYEMLEADYLLLPTKPTMDAEPNYEDHPVMSPRWTWSEGDEWFDDYDCRKSAYRSVLAGACGHTYGCHDIWQMYDPARNPAVNHARTPWPQALELPGAEQVQHLRTLWESRSPLQRRPDQAMLLYPQGQCDPARHMRAMSAADGSHALIYTPVPEPIRPDLSRLGGRAIASWFNPRTGHSTPLGSITDVGEGISPPEADGPDWVLVLDAAGPDDMGTSTG